MNSRFLNLSVIFLLIISLSNCNVIKTDHRGKDEIRVPPYTAREFRAAWVATVANINWPTQPGLSVDEQKNEAVFLLDLLADNNFNAVIFQVRPQCDALYQSSLEPWSYYLTGQQGKAPDPFYDPLDFWISEAHKRGLELHVWLNPYRAHHITGGELTEHSIVRRKPELAVKLENGIWWLDPGKKGTQDHSASVVRDLVSRYDIDGVHFDDYFYPYPSYNNNKEFPDEDTYQNYIINGGKLSRKDWRRENVNSFISRVYDEIKTIKPHVKFGLSPFGIWRPGYPESIAGFDQYDQLYADARLWLNKGWIDYFTPQLYWPVNQYNQSFPVLLGWWDSENLKQRHVWPGMNIGRFEGEKASDEVINQIMITRGFLQNNSGQVHWSIGPLISNPILLENLKSGPYKKQALIPAFPWLDKNRPEKPLADISVNRDSLIVELDHTELSDVFKWVVYYRYGSDWEYEILPAENKGLKLPIWKINLTELTLLENPTEMDIEKSFKRIRGIQVSSVDRNGNESLKTDVNLDDTDYVEKPESSPFLEQVESIKKEIAIEKTDDFQIQLGVEVLLREHLSLLKDKRTGLITNPSAVDRNMTSTVDLLSMHPEVDLVALFGAEHGIRGAKQGKIFREGDPDPITGIPVYSLYGESYAPKKEWLEGIDVLIFDIQGVGSAWYTFKYSMSFAMEACAEAGIQFIVLDRPNPLGGLEVEGPYLNLGGIFRHKLPLRHGMTYGELAAMWNETEGINADLKVIKMKGWSRDMMWDDTGLEWVMPSPNMGTYETALVYPGQCLFERSNISEARGTTKPFLLSGAPWINAQKAAEDLNKRQIPGALFRPVYFIPEKSETGSNPRGKPWNKLCGGVEILVTDPEKYKSIPTTLNVFDAYIETNPDSLLWDPPEPINLLEQQEKSVNEIYRMCQEEIEDFLEIRNRYLLY